MAEAYALFTAVEHGLRTRAAIVDMRGQLNIRWWEKTAAAALGHLSALKPLIWVNRGDCDSSASAAKAYGALSDGRQAHGGLASTHRRAARATSELGSFRLRGTFKSRLIETLSTSIFDMRSTEKSLAIKAKKQEVENIEERTGTVARF